VHIRIARVFQHCLFLLLLLAAGCSANLPRADFEGEKNGLLWQISQQGKPLGYLFGTIHSEDERVIKLPEPVNFAFETSTIFALEMELDKAATQSVLRNMYFQNGQNLKQVINLNLYQRAISAMADKGIPEDIVQQMKPWAVFSILNMPKQRTGKYLDAVLYQSAIEKQKNIVGLESFQEQIAVFDEMSLEIQIKLLSSTLDNLQDMDKMLDETINVYLSRDLNQIMALSDKYNAMLDKDVGEIFVQRLLLDRNHRMYQRMLPLLSSGNVFVAVGALHLPGDEGLLNLLKQNGFKVKALY